MTKSRRFLVALASAVLAMSSCGARTELESPCPTPHPRTCNYVFACLCADGTKQAGGCVNGFSCDEACCGHGGSEE